MATNADVLARPVDYIQRVRALAPAFVDAQAHQDGGVGGAADRGEARIGLEPVDREGHRRQWPEGLLGVR